MLTVVRFWPTCEDFSHYYPNSTLPTLLFLFQGADRLRNSRGLVKRGRNPSLPAVLGYWMYLGLEEMLSTGCSSLSCSVSVPSWHLWPLVAPGCSHHPPAVALLSCCLDDIIINLHPVLFLGPQKVWRFWRALNSTAVSCKKEAKCLNLHSSCLSKLAENSNWSLFPGDWDYLQD